MSLDNIVVLMTHKCRVNTADKKGDGITHPQTIRNEKERVNEPFDGLILFYLLPA